MHKEYKRIVEGSGRAILFIHGIAGTPNHFKGLLPLVGQDLSVYNILLDGHGKGVRDFSRSSMKKWKDQTFLTVEELASQHEEIYIVAHSLGCLLAIEQAMRNPKIKGLFLLAVPLKLFLKPKMLINSLRIYFNKINPRDEVLIAAKECYGITDDKNILLYLGWIPRYLELFSKIRKIRKIVECVKIPCVACQSSRDEVVSCASSDILKRNPLISVTELENSGHYYYEKNDFSVVKERFLNFLSQRL